MKSDWSTQIGKTFLAIAMMATFCVPATSLLAQDKDASQSKKKQPTRVIKAMTPVEGYAPVEMFAAKKEGTIKVELIPKDATQANIFVTNNSDEPLAVGMPEAFVGVPILAQGLGGGGMGGGGRGGGGGGGGFFNIPPGKRAKLTVTTVCLEFNKTDPRPSMKYEIKPAREYVKDESVLEMIRMVANDEVTQQIAQAAAWHRMDGLSWDFLANHNRKEFSNGYYERFFTLDQIRWAQQLVPFANQRVAARQAQKPAESRSWKTGQ